MDILGENTFGGIPGLDLELRREVYIRHDMEPVFMTERSPSRNRIDVVQLMEDVGLDHYDRLEWLIRTTSRYIGDDLLVMRYEEPSAVSFSDDLKKDLAHSSRMILSALASGGEVSIGG